MKSAIKLNEMVNSLFRMLPDGLNPSGMYQFFPAQSDGDMLSSMILKILRQKLKRFNSQVKNQNHFFV